MAQYIVTDTELEAVADAIRSKRGINAQLEWPSDFVSAIGAITTGEVGGSVNILSGTDTPTASVGNDGDIYFQTEPSYDDSGEGWIARKGSVCKSTSDLGTVSGRHYYKTTDEPALVAFGRKDGYWQPVTASTIPTACGYKASSGGPWTYDYTYVIDGVTWYFFSGNHGYSGNPTVSTEYPILQSVDFSTQNGAEEFLSIMSVRFDSGDDTQVIADSYCKVNGEWKPLIGRYTDEVNMGSGGNINDPIIFSSDSAYAQTVYDDNLGSFTFSLSGYYAVLAVIDGNNSSTLTYSTTASVIKEKSDSHKPNTYAAFGLFLILSAQTGDTIQVTGTNVARQKMQIVFLTPYAKAFSDINEVVGKDATKTCSLTIPQNTISKYVLCFAGSTGDQSPAASIESNNEIKLSHQGNNKIHLIKAYEGNDSVDMSASGTSYSTNYCGYFEFSN